MEPFDVEISMLSADWLRIQHTITCPVNGARLCIFFVLDVEMTCSHRTYYTDTHTHTPADHSTALFGLSTDSIVYGCVCMVRRAVCVLVQSHNAASRQSDN